MIWSLLWSGFEHLWWALPSGLALAAVAAFAFGVWPAVLVVLRKLPGAWQAALITLVLVLVAASGLYALGRAHEAQAHAGEIDALQLRLDAALDANESNLEAIGQLTKANQAWADAAAAKDKETAEAVAAITAERDRLSAELERRRKDRQRIYANDPDAADWARRPVPAAVADRLRE